MFPRLARWSCSHRQRASSPTSGRAGGGDRSLSGRRALGQKEPRYYFGLFEDVKKVPRTIGCGDGEQVGNSTSIDNSSRWLFATLSALFYNAFPWHGGRQLQEFRRMRIEKIIDCNCKSQLLLSTIYHLSPLSFRLEG